MPKSDINFIQSRVRNFRKHFLLAGIFLLLAAITLGAFYFYKKSENKKVAQAKVSGASINSGSCVLPKDWLEKYFHTDNANDPKVGGSDGDPDNDLLTNCQEYFFGTDPTNPDTNGNGSLDGIDIAFGYDPKGKGKLQVSKESATQLLNSLGPEYQQFSQENLQKKVEDLFQPNREIVFDMPDDKELKIANENMESGYEKYYNDAKAILASDESEVKNISESMFTLDPNQINSYISKLQATEKVLKEIPVPSDIVNIQKLRVAEIRAGVKMFELVRDEYKQGGDNKQFWADYFYQMSVAEQAHVFELVAWKQLYDLLKANGAGQ